ncbi:MAG: hypothetical protein E7016_04265 [Alphaproteobacteria bacterium]|nr:hypothetical protein [Alphaproteobacteria bacterium]
MEDISKLIQQAKPLYFARKRRRKMINSAGAIMCGCFLVFMTSFKQETVIYDVWMDEVYSASNGSVIEDLGLPVDEYGLLWVG